MIIADLHIHSHYSRATSKHLDFPNLTKWAQLKGVNLLGTGDIAHPGWLKEMREHLEPAGGDLFRLKPDMAQAVRAELPAACQAEVRFMLAGEISNIYKRHDAVRKVHNVIFAPTLDAVERIQLRLEKIGNIRSDGRPILGLDSRDLLELILEVDERCHLIPAHIWTPWFSMLGSKSGFDTVEECFGDLTDRIFAVETGLSSDPPMNWRLSMLDPYTLVSHSDAHSPQKLAREATLFDTEWSYDAIFDALKSGDPARYKGTIEFFPEEGKYHMDGHRKCGVCWHPQTTIAHGGRCSECGRPVTVGVMHRVEELADRPVDGRPERVAPFHSLIPLPEILAELNGVGVNTKTVNTEFMRLLTQLGSELAILLSLPLEQIAQAGGEKLAAGIGRMRQGKVAAQGGYDGEFGVIRLFSGSHFEEAQGQIGLFPDQPPRLDLSQPTPPPPPPSAPPVEAESVRAIPLAPPGQPWDASLLNPEQRAAVETVHRSLVMVAGPGTGKTRTVTARLAHLLTQEGVDPRSILAITFTNKAAQELASRLTGMVGQALVDAVTVATFHSFAARLVQEWAEKLDLPERFAILDEAAQLRLLRQACPELSRGEAQRRLAQISQAKNQLLTPQIPRLHEKLGVDEAFASIYSRYQTGLRRAAALDFDDLILEAVNLLELNPLTLMTVQERFRWISVDEYQDVNLAQYRLLRLLTQAGANLCVVGDPDQAIYGFRGGDPRYFQRFVEDYPGARQLHLTRSYRSTQSILRAAGQVIARNPERAERETWSDVVNRLKVTVHEASTERAEAEFVVQQIEEMMGGISHFSLDSGRVGDGSQSVVQGFGDFGVLFRLNALAPPLVEAFERSGIPFQWAGQLPFWQRPEVQGYLAYLWSVAVPQSRLHWQRLLAGEGGSLPGELLDRLPLDGSASPAEVAAALADLAYASGIAPAQARRLAGLADLYPRLAKPDLTVGEGLALVHAFAQEWEEAPLAPQALAHLTSRAEGYGDRLRDFLQDAALQSEADVYEHRADRVSLMSIHAAKGLEFATVFVVGCEEGLLPYARDASGGNGAEREALAEERRLFYVGMTRAADRLILSHARRRWLFGQSRQAEPSPFLDDIEAALKEVSERRSPPRPGEKAVSSGFQLPLF
jgi:uncharacterized protein (TIGR00375 family)